MPRHAHACTVKLRITFLLFPLATATVEVANNNNRMEQCIDYKRQLLHFVYRCSEIFGDNRNIMLDVLTMMTLEVTLF